MKVLPAYKCTQDINYFLYLNQANKEYENLYINNYFNEIKPIVDSWSEISICFYDDLKIVGWIFISISRPTEVINIDSFCVIDKKFTTSIFRSIFNVLRKRVNKRVPKITFSAMVDSYADKIWRKITKKYNGDIVGIKKNHWLDQNGDYRDCIMFEIHNSNFKDSQTKNE